MNFNKLNLVLMLWSMIILSACVDKKDEKREDPKVANLKLPKGFKAERLFGPSENEEGSWVSMTFDDKGRLIASDQYGSLYRMTLPPIGDTTAVKVEQLSLPDSATSANGKSKVSIGYAHGLLWAFNSLYVMINHQSDSAFSKGSGLYRVQDSNSDDQFDTMTLLKALDGEGEHGPHSIVLSPDKKSLYVIAGNFTRIPEMNAYRNKPDSKLDNLIPLIKDPNGHDNVVNWHGGWIANVDSTGSNWELISSGFRNPFDLAFNDAGDMFTYDSDMEWDIGTPWYRPTRICHVTSGSEFGWRPGTAKWSPMFDDNLPAVLNIGQGSPTNVVSGMNAHFPKKYRKAIFAFDWSFGIVYAVHLEPDGSSYRAKGEEFLSGSPLPLTDGVIGPDGALYFLTGGRRLESDLYRVYYDGDEDALEAPSAITLNDDQKLRRKLEEFHGAPKSEAVDYVWPYLKHPDRFIRYAARIALEHQPVSLWQRRVLTETAPMTHIEGAVALARKGEVTVRDPLLKSLMSIDFDKLTTEGKIDLVRAMELTMSRLGIPSSSLQTDLITYLDKHFPSTESNELNRELVKVLAYLQSPTLVDKTVPLLTTANDDTSDGQQTSTNSADLIMRNPQYGIDIASTLSKLPPAQQTYYATVLSHVKTGWGDQTRESYYKWFYGAFNYRGGHSFPGFIDGARQLALAHAPKGRLAYYREISGDSIIQAGGSGLTKSKIQPKGPWRYWSLDDATKVLGTGIKHRSFESGKGMFSASLCIACHTMRGEGGTAGPELTQLGTRFSYRDMLESILEPNKSISDQYGTTVFEMKDGTSVVGRLISADGDQYVISQNPFAPQVVRELKKVEVIRTYVSKVSPMLPGLINSLNEEELKDLLAYLKAGGNPKDSVFMK